ncbi:dimethyladenosine transferase [Egicoccus sp. AB-alg6-2]|uniref:dimethyladenosine transferase n=1 Tax=Egicoccus sp. AB-alg6-2 TaxID=3242692 RepID=UPI00359D2AB1
MAKRTRKVSASRVIEADRQAIFDILADPAQHPLIDGSGTVSDVQPNGPERLHEGGRFGMEMKLGVPYKILNTVVEFEEGRRIAWRHFHGHRWRYELEDTTTPEGRPATLVTESFDWSRARTKIWLDLSSYPRRNLDSIVETLARLDAHVGARR